MRRDTGTVWNSFKMKTSMVVQKFKVMMRDSVRKKGAELEEGHVSGISVSLTTEILYLGFGYGCSLKNYKC